MQFGNPSVTAKNPSPNRSEKSRRNKSALNSALSLLSRRPYSQKEVFDHLIRHWPESDVSTAISKLKELKFIDDDAFAIWYKESRLRSRPMSAKLLAFELKRKGLEIRNLKLEISEPELAKQALAKKKNLNRQQAMRFLASRSFSWDVIETVLKKRYNDS
ncbi:MAG: regulatory protein RecX, partial [Patescibacteria group bacterium]